MRKQKATKLGSRKLHFPKSDLGVYIYINKYMYIFDLGVYIWQQSRL